MVTIYVGPERKRYLIHKDLLTKQSEFFDRALNGNFKEAEENSIYLEEESPAAFDLLVSLLYKGDVAAIGPPLGGFKAPEVEVVERNPMISGAILQMETLDGTSYRRLVGPSQMGVHMSTIAFITPPENKGTSKVAYRPHTEPSTGFPYPPNPVASAVDLIASISTQKEYRKWSPEELRLADYRDNMKWNALTSLQSLQDVTTDLISTSTASSPTATSATSDPITPFTRNGGGTHLRGIPHAPPLSALTDAEEAHQLALLSLCLLGETLCWPSVFNAGMSAYLLGEATLSGRRALPASHIALIYTRAHCSSPVRLFAADAAVSHLGAACAQSTYADLGCEFPAFLDDVFGSLGGMAEKEAGLGLRHAAWIWKGACPAYHVHAEGETCVRDCFGDELRKVGEGSRGLFGRADDGQLVTCLGVPTKSWMGWRDTVGLLHRGLEDF